jgi:WD40 repeat protein
MKKNIFLICLLLLTIVSMNAQSSLDSLRLVLELGHKYELKNFEFSPNGKYIISDVYGEVIIYNALSCKEIFKTGMDEGLSNQLIKNYSLNDRIIFIDRDLYSDDTATTDEAAIVDLNDGSVKLLKIPYEDIMFIEDVFFSFNDRYIVILNNEKYVIYDVDSLKKVKDFNGKTTLSSDRKFALSLCEHNTLVIWDIINGKETRLNEWKDEKINHAKFSPDGNFVIIFFDNGFIGIWDVVKGKTIKIFEKYTDGSDENNALMNSWEKEKYKQKQLSEKIKFSPDMKHLFVVNNKDVEIWDFQNLIKKEVIKNESTIKAIKFSSDGKKFFTVSEDKIAKIYDFEMVKEIFSFYTDGKIVQIEFSYDSKFIFIAVDNKIKVFNSSDGTQFYVLDSQSFSLSPLGSVLIKYDPVTLKIHNVKTGKEIKRIQKKALRAERLEITKDNKYVISSSWGAGTFEPETGKSENLPSVFEGKDLIANSIHTKYDVPVEVSSQDGKLEMKYFDDCYGIFDVATEKVKYTVACLAELLANRPVIVINPGEPVPIPYVNPLFIRSADFSLDGSLAAISINPIPPNKEYTDIIDVYSGKKIISIGSIGFAKNTVISPNNKFVLINHHSHSCPTVYEISTGLKIFELCGHDNSGVLDALFLPNGKFIITTGIDHKTIIWDAKTGQKIYTRYMLDFSNWLVQLPNSPYYMCSKDASKMLHYVTPSLKVIGFEQLDPVYNRPDIVLDSIGKYFGNEDRGMIEEYRKAWEKRIERLGLKDQMDKLGKGEISVPNAEIENAATIDYENSDGIVNLKIKANDSKFKLRRFNIWVNEVPMYGSNGISIAGLNKNNWDTTLSVPLSLGDNKIQVSVMNELGLENFKYPIYVNYKSEKVVPKTYFIGIAVDNFNNGKNLSFCVKDVEDLSNYFSKLPNSQIKLLTEKEVTKENITQLKEYLQKTSVHDRVIISCNSHGLLDSTRNFYLATHDTDFDSPNLNGISYEMLDGLLDDIPARKKLLLLDACNSGENDEGYAKIDNSSSEGRGVNVVIGDEIVKETNFKKMKELFVNVRNNSGAYIISATGGIQKALEGEAVMLDGKQLENGSFTFAVLEYLKANSKNSTMLTVGQLKKYVENRVVEITNGKQTPTSRQETMEIDWDLR